MRHTHTHKIDIDLHQKIKSFFIKLVCNNLENLLITMLRYILVSRSLDLCFKMNLLVYDGYQM